MAGKKIELNLKTYDDIFSTQEMRDEEKLAKIREIPLELIDDFQTIHLKFEMMKICST